jgi:signal transduction histidine kinase
VNKKDTAQKIWYASSALLLVISTALLTVVFVANASKSKKEIYGFAVSYTESALNSELNKIADEIYSGRQPLPSTVQLLNSKLAGLASIDMTFEASTDSFGKDTDEKNIQLTRPAGSSTSQSMSRIGLYYGDVLLGRLQTTVIWNKTLMSESFTESFAALFPFLLLLLLVWSAVFYLINKKIIEPIALQNELFLKSNAIARTTQSLAHDIRRPFSMLKLAFEAFSSAKDSADAHSQVQLILPEVNRAIVNVEGMLQDVMQIGSTAKPYQEEASVEDLVNAVMGDVFRIFPDKEFSVDYQFAHNTTLFVDTIRVTRLLTNILVNAIQAMNSHGRIWIETTHRGAFIEFTVGNSGSHIPREHLNKLFEAFFTEGKRGGNGLGLAIAHKVIMEHGGKIRCESERSVAHPDGFVEFIFTLPAGTLPAPPLRARQFASSAEFRTHIGRMTAGKDLTGRGKKLKIVYLDDTQTFTLMWKMKLRDKINLETYSETGTFLRHCVADAAYLHSFDLIITDYYFGEGDPHTGETLALELRNFGFKGPILLATNGDFSEQKLSPSITATIGKEVPSTEFLERVIFDSKFQAPENSEP